MLASNTSTLRKSFIITIGFIVFLLSSCTSAREPRLRIGVSQCSEGPWRAKQNAEMERELLLHDGISMELICCHDNSQQQIKDIRYFIDQKVDLIIVSPNEPEDVTPTIGHDTECRQGLTYLVAYVLRVATEVIELSFYGGDPNVTMLIALDSRCIAETWVTGQWSECSGVEHVEPKIGAHPKTLCGILVGSGRGVGFHDAHDAGGIQFDACGLCQKHVAGTSQKHAAQGGSSLLAVVHKV